MSTGSRRAHRSALCASRAEHDATRAAAQERERYGSDKPDLRYELPIEDVSDVVAKSPFQVFSGAIVREAL